MKPAKPLWRVSVATTLEAEDAVSELLAALLGSAASAYFDLEAQTSLVSVFSQKILPRNLKSEIVAGLKQIENYGLKLGGRKITVAKVKREDWAESWKRHFHPQEFGAALLIKPSWSKKYPRKNQAVVILDPGLSFGTGQHPTTSFCLHEIVRSRKNGTPMSSFLDIGTGSGILAIAAAMLGYAPVHAFDFDGEAVRVARDNTRKNKVDSKLKPTRGDITKLPLKAARQYDLICANLISNLLIAERRRIINRLKPGGTLVLAGILAAEFAEVEKAFADNGLSLITKQVENEWCSGSFCFV
jgi:ribosomal protein L11 methyltransferase